MLKGVYPDIMRPYNILCCFFFLGKNGENIMFHQLEREMLSIVIGYLLLQHGLA
jgi:hypothetical protein